MNNEIIRFVNGDLQLDVTVSPDNETVWLNRNQIAQLFGRDIKTIGKHINNALKEELSNEVVVAKFTTTSQHGAIEFDLLFRRNAEKSQMFVFLYRYLLINIAFFENLANDRRTLLWCQIPFRFVAYYPLLLADS